MIIKRLQKLACLGLIGLGCIGATAQAQDWNGQPGWQFPTQNYGNIEGAESVYLYSPQRGWQQVPVVRNGQLPSRYVQPGSARTAMPQSGDCNCGSSHQWSGYRSFWVPLKDVPMYQNDSRFRVVTPVPKETPVAPALPPKPVPEPKA